MTKQLGYNPLMDTDSYKLSHWTQYPEGMTSCMSYFESRGGEFDECTLFGLQYLIDTYLSQPFSLWHVYEAAAFAEAHGEPFNAQGFVDMLAKYKGFFPVRIRALPEGTVVPVKNALLTVESTDPEFAWVVSYLETMLVRLWYPSTIATQSRESKKVLKEYLDLTSEDTDSEIQFKLHDFGGRGVSCLEQSRLGGAAHLLSFMGSDTIEGVRMANFHYDTPMAGFSIPASEHSTVSSWLKDGEFDMFRAYIKRQLTDRVVPPGVPKLAACVSDTWSVYEATTFFSSPEVVEILKASGGTLVIRPDSGDPTVVLPKVLGILEAALGDEVRANSKGYKVLPSYLRLIQGDGIDINTMSEILEVLTKLGWSASNIAFGSGGGLLQKVNRDTQKFAFKCCSVTVNGVQREVFKDPITDPGKRSKSGRLDLVRTVGGEYHTVKLDPWEKQAYRSVLETVYENGPTDYRTTFAECRERMKL